MKKSVLIAIFLILLIVPIAFAFSLGGKEVFSLNKVFSDFFNKLTGITGKIIGATCTTKTDCTTGEICQGIAPNRKCALCTSVIAANRDTKCANQYGIGYTCNTVNDHCEISGGSQTCAQKGGTICASGQTCSVAVISSSDSSDCCVGTCSFTGACTDLDNDGYGLAGSTGCPHTGVDCNDNNVLINPGKSEVCTNVNAAGIGIDDNCDNLINCQDTIACPCLSTQVCDPTTHLCKTGANECPSNLCVLGESSYKECSDSNGDGWKELATTLTDCPAGQTCSLSGNCMSGDRTLPCESQTISTHNYCSASDCSIANRLQSSDTTSNYVCCSAACAHINSAPYFINVTTIPANTTSKEANLKIKAIVTLNDPNLGDRLNISYTWYQGGYYPYQYNVNISNITRKHSMPNATNVPASSTWIVLTVPYNLTSYSIGYNYTLGFYACDGRLCNQTNSSRINITTTAGLPACTTPNVLCTTSLPSCPVDHQLAHSESGICCSQACTTSITCTPTCAGETPTCESVSGVCKCTSTSCGSGKTCNAAGSCESSVSSTTAGCTVGSGATARIIPVGTRANVASANSYCNIDNTWIAQKITDVSCQNDYECTSNVCKGNKCVDISKIIENVGLLKQIWCKITHPTNDEAYDCCAGNPFGSTAYYDCINSL